MRLFLAAIMSGSVAALATPVLRAEANPSARLAQVPVVCPDPRMIGCVEPRHPRPVLVRQGAASAVSGVWTIKDHEGSTLGTADLQWRGDGAAALSGTIRIWLSMGGTMAHEGRARLRRASGGALDIAMRADEGQIYRLLVAVPRPGAATTSGSLFDGQDLRPVTLSRQVATPTPAPSDDDFVEDEPEEFDLPGVGVSGPAYGLIGVPTGKRLAVRKRGDRGAESVGTLAADAAEILVMGCEPYMEAYQYEALNDAGKRQVLDSSWCEIRHEDVGGFIPGRYLEAIVR